MNVPSPFTDDFRLLNDVLESHPSEIAATLALLMTETALAVPSYLGLAVVVVRPHELPLEISTFDNDLEVDQIGTSLRFRIRKDSAVDEDGHAVIELIIYAATPGALVDLAADLTWLTGRPPGEIRLDEDLVVAKRGVSTRSLASWSTVNQALGVLIGSGMTTEEADAELSARAALTEGGRHLAAFDLLARLPFRDRPITP